MLQLKFIYSEKATKFCEISNHRFDRYYIGKIYGGDLAFSEYMNFTKDQVAHDQLTIPL